MRLVSRRLVPFLFVLYVFNVLDRTNVGIAALQMNGDLAFSSAAFGVGAGIFFFGYSLFEVPSNLMLARVGARRWIALILIAWGTVASCLMFVRTPLQFYVLRLLLGAAEAGFFPGIIFYLCQWFPSTQRATATSRFMIAIPLSAALGGPLGGALLGLRGIGHLSGWQWLFLVEGVPSAILGVVALKYLDDGPKDAPWLPIENRIWLSDRMSSECEAAQSALGTGLLQTLFHPLVWILALPYFLALTVWYGYVFWAPIVVREAIGSSDANTGLIIGAIAALSAVAMLAMGASSDRGRERCVHAAAGIGLAGVGFLAAAWGAHPFLRIAALTLVSIGGLSFLVPFWCLPTMLFRGKAAAVAIALVSSLGSVGGFVGPTLIGSMKDAASGQSNSFLLMAFIALAASGFCLALRRRPEFGGVRVLTGAMRVDEPRGTQEIGALDSDLIADGQSRGNADHHGHT
jgi:ACS family tartrate transporter-like MFS transporter